MRDHQFLDCVLEYYYKFCSFERCIQYQLNFEFNFRFNKEITIHKILTKKTTYQNVECFVLIPSKVNSDTKPANG